MTLGQNQPLKLLSYNVGFVQQRETTPTWFLHQGVEYTKWLAIVISSELSNVDLHVGVELMHTVKTKPSLLAQAEVIHSSFKNAYYLNI